MANNPDEDWLRDRIALARRDTGPVVDVRSAAEHAAGHLPAGLNIPLTHLAERFGEIPSGRPVVVHCEGGYRSAIAASLLQKLRVGKVHDLVGGYKAWVAAKLPTHA